MLQPAGNTHINDLPLYNTISCHFIYFFVYIQFNHNFLDRNYNQPQTYQGAYVVIFPGGW